jgi:erythronate-4-phosphate dehydrogenase
VDTAYLEASGREFQDAKGCNANSVAEYVVFSILHWANTYRLDLRNKTLGVVGYGNIGRRVAELGYRLGLRILVSDPPLKEAGGEFALYCRNTSFNELLQESDIITNHVHYLADGGFPTVGLFDEQAFERIRPNTLFIHASRGGIVQEEALWKTVKTKNIVPVVDVWEAEPRIHAGLVQRALLATPHTAGYSYEGKINGSVMMATAYCGFLQRTVEPSIDADWGLFERALANHSLPLLHLSDHASVYAALRESRRLEEDTENLRNIVDMPDQEAQFDALRKEYPQRREILLG